MRYTIVTETYPPEINGVALTVQDLERGLRARGHSVEVIRPRQSGNGTTQQLEHELLVRGSGIRVIPACVSAIRRGSSCVDAGSSSAPTRSISPPKARSAIRRCAQQHRMGIPVTTGFHTRFDEYMPITARPSCNRWRCAGCAVHNTSQATLVPTCGLADFLNDNGFEDVVHLPRAVDTARFSPARRSDTLRTEWGLGPNDLAVIYLGRIAAEKNLPLAIRAFHAIQARRPDARFVWVGEGGTGRDPARASRLHLSRPASRR